MRISSQVVLEMLKVRFNRLSTEGFREFTLSSDKGTELIVQVFIAGVKKQLSHGLEREYNRYQELLTTVRGNIDVNSSMRDFTLNKRKIWCQFDEYSSNSPRNRILKNTLKKLEVCSQISKELRDEVSKIVVAFHDVGDTTTRDRQLARMKGSNGRDGYGMLMSLCEVIDKCLIGESGLVNEFVYDQRFVELFRSFVFDEVQFCANELGLECEFVDDKIMQVGEEAVSVRVECLSSEYGRSLPRIERQISLLVREQIELLKGKDKEDTQCFIVIGYNNNVKLAERIFRFRGSRIVVSLIPICSSKFLFSSAYGRMMEQMRKCLRKV